MDVRRAIQAIISRSIYRPFRRHCYILDNKSSHCISCGKPRYKRCYTRVPVSCLKEKKSFNQLRVALAADFFCNGALIEIITPQFVMSCVLHILSFLLLFLTRMSKFNGIHQNEVSLSCGTEPCFHRAKNGIRIESQPCLDYSSSPSVYRTND